MTRYRLSNVVVDSELSLPSLPILVPSPTAPAVPTAPPDVLVRFGPVAATLADARLRGAAFEVASGRLLQRVPALADYLVRRDEVVIAPCTGPYPDAQSAAMAAHFLTSIVSALLTLRGRLVLRASAVDVDDRRVVIAGPSGAGKSTLAAQLCRRGARFVADDVVAVSFGDGCPRVEVGAPVQRLWPDALTRLGLDPDAYAADLPGVERRSVPVSPDAMAHPSAPVRDLYHLVISEDGGPTFSRLTGREIVRSLEAVARARLYAAPLGLRRDHFAHLARLAPAVRAARVARPQHGLSPERLADALLAEVHD